MVEEGRSQGSLCRSDGLGDGAPAMQKINVGIIGGGMMGRELASAMVRWCHLMDVPVKPVPTAVASKTEKSLQWFTENIATIRQATTDYRDILANPEVHAVYCAVPHNLHQKMYIDIIEAGKHLLGEKPFGIDMAANRKILDTADRHPELVIRCSSQWAYYPGAQRIVKMVLEGSVGRIIEVECGFLHSSDLNPDKLINWKRIVEINGEYGCMGDLGMHVWWIPIRLGWIPRRVGAILSNIVTTRPESNGGRVPCNTWDNANIYCEVEQNGHTFPLTARMHRIDPGEMNSWYLGVKGDRCSAHFSTKYPRTLKILRYDPADRQRWQHEDLGHEALYPTITGGIFEFGYSDAILQMLASFFHEIASAPNGKAPFMCVTPAETAVSHRIFTAALKAYGSGRSVEI